MNVLDQTLKPTLDTLKHDLEAELGKEPGIVMKHENIRPGPLAREASTTDQLRQIGGEAELKRFFSDGDRMLQVARRRVIELEMSYGQKRRMLVNRAKDEMHKLEVEHEAQLEAVNQMIARLEALRSGG